MTLKETASQPPVFIQLNDDWGAEPNAPNPDISINGSTLKLRFFLNQWAYTAKPWQRGVLTFTNCLKWRLGPTNDEGWYRGQCRYGRIAPKWGEFYQIAGLEEERDSSDDWTAPDTQGLGESHFLFYFRDETFECLASDWAYEGPRTRAALQITGRILKWILRKGA